MGVLRLRIVGVELRETHVGNLAPLARASLDITIIKTVERMFLDALVELDGIVECLAVVGGTGIF